ncbi:MAG: hypothetical protein JNN15_20765 [Blastocatellia bacterium]|nr:hypothetical protein [Blastocatellia bacterium]
MREICEDITCKVDVGKSTSSYTMMLAEIGLPPGVEVDKESIKRDDGAYGISSYEILPDRLIVYFWAYKNATTFKFKFRPKYKMKAKSASSQVYNYYNPEESATVAPSLFVIK